MRYLVGLVVGAMLIGGGCGNVMAGNTTMSAGVGGWFVWESDHVSTSAIPISVSYRPDVFADGTLGPSPSALSFTISQVVRDGSEDLTMLGVGYSAWQSANLGIELVPEVAGIIKYMENNTGQLGGYLGLGVPFTVNSQPFGFRVGGGYDGEFPVGQVALSFTTE